MTSNNPSSDAILYAIILGGLGMLLEPKIEAFQASLKHVNWVRIIILFAASVALIVALVHILCRFVREKRKRRQNQRDKENRDYWCKQRVGKILDYDLSDLNKSCILKKIDEISKIDDSDYNRYAGKLNKALNNLHKQLNKLEEIEENKRRHREKKEKKKAETEAKEKKIFWQKVDELLSFKIKNNSKEALPLNKHYPSDVIDVAESKADYHFRDLKRKQEIREEAIKYYKENNLNTQPRLHDVEFEIYEQVRKEIRNGTINVQEEEDTFDRDFYRATELDPIKKKVALACGFEHVKGAELDGKLTGGFYIRRNQTNESPYHFYMKHLFSELNDKFKLEYAADGKRTDVAYVDKYMSLAIEIETGTNSDAHITEKVKWLDTSKTSAHRCN